MTTPSSNDFPKPRIMSDLVITAANSPYLIDRDHQNLIVQNWRMADNTRIEFAPDVTRWVIVANRASFGRGVVIDGSRPRSPNGADGRAGGPGPDCQEGRYGTRGEDGHPGQAGVSIQATLRLDQVGDVQVLLRGGDGGNGGRGGDGGRGGAADCSKGCKGGDGALGHYGGNAGPGGQGGNFHMEFRYLTDPPGGQPERPSGFRVRSDGGAAGQPGTGGEGGKGGPGKKCPIFNRGSGRQGRKLGPGRAAYAGSPGTVTFRLIRQSSFETFWQHLAD